MKFNFSLFALIVSMMFSSVAHAGHHRGNSVAETVEISASPNEVWNKAKDFGNLQGWHPAVKGSTNNAGNQIGSVRVLDLGGPTITEKLISFNEESKSFAYQITEVDPAVLPVQNYVSWFQVKDNGKGGTEITWMGDFGVVGEANPADVQKGVRGIYRAGLDNLKNIFESSGEDEALEGSE